MRYVDSFESLVNVRAINYSPSHIHALDLSGACVFRTFCYFTCWCLRFLVFVFVMYYVYYYLVSGRRSKVIDLQFDIF